jgi:hypothetical protein
MAAHIHDQSPTGLPEQRDDSLTDLEDASEIQLQQPLPLFEGHPGEGACPGASSVVHHDGGLKPSGAKLPNPGINGSRFGKINAGCFHLATLRTEGLSNVVEFGRGTGNKE